MVKQLGGSGDGKKIVMINGAPTDNNAKLFKQGAHEVLDKSGVDIAKEYDTPDWSPDKAQSQMEQALTSVGKDIDGVYSANDGMAGGIIAALKGAGVTPGKLAITGQDAELAGIQRIIAGEQGMTVYKAIKPEAEAAADARRRAAARRGAAGEPRQRQDRQRRRPTVPSVLLKPIAVNKDNVADTVIKDGFLKAADVCTGRVRQGLHGRRDLLATMTTETQAGATTAPAGAGPLLELRGSEQELRGRAAHWTAPTSRSIPARSSPWSATTAPASRRSSRRSPAPGPPTAARSSSTASARHDPQPRRLGGARHRGRLPGPRAVRQPRRRREPVPRPRARRSRARGARADGRGLDGAGDAEAARVAERDDAELGARGGRDALRRPAPVDRDRALADRRAAARHPRRADRGARRRPDRAGARPDQAPEGARPGVVADLPQPVRRLRGLRPHRRCCASAATAASTPPTPDQHQAVSPRSPASGNGKVAS